MPETTLTDVLTEIGKQREFIESKFKESSDSGVRYEEEMKALKTRIAELEAKLAPNSVHLPGVESEAKKFSWSKAIYAITTDDWSRSGFEKEVFTATAQKAMEAGTGTGGGFLVPVEVTQEGLIPLLESMEVLSQLGVSKLTGLSGIVEIPKQTGGATAYWVGENQDITESELTFGTLSLSPKSVAALVKTSNRLLMMANPSVDAIITRDIALRLALKISLAGFRGQGTSTQPRGIANTAGINVVYANGVSDDGGYVDFDVLQNMEGALEDDDALFGNLKYVFAPAIRRYLMKLKVAQYSGDTGGAYILQPMTPDKLKEWMGYDFMTSTQIPTNLTFNDGTNITELYFANWSEFILAMWGGVQLAKSTEASDAFTKNQTWVRIIQDVDMGVRHPESFCICPDAKKA